MIIDCHIRYSGGNENDDEEGDAEGEIANGLEGNFVTPVSVNRPPRRYIFHKQDKIPKTLVLPSIIFKATVPLTTLCDHFRLDAKFLIPCSRSAIFNFEFAFENC